MSFNQGEIINYEFQIPGNARLEYHPGIILSCNDVFIDDECYVIAMMSSIQTIDKYSFCLNNDMLENPIDSKNGFSQVRCHLITYALKKFITDLRPKNKLKAFAFERLIAHINVVVFDV
ncbi:MAG: hypothetical protein V5804_14585 [Mucilaginibacter sp.]|uniref:hypothetical protein n=1 Tax=Mucilaginibacter sp. TaxID=1882438 RepID=UPI0034E60A50